MTRSLYWETWWASTLSSAIYHTRSFGGSTTVQFADISLRFKAGRLGLVFGVLCWKIDFCFARKCYVFHYNVAFVVCHEL